MSTSRFDSLRRINELCLELIRSLDSARLSEEKGQGGVLAYGNVSTFALLIRTAAEQRREALARTQWDHVADENIRHPRLVECPLDA